HPGAGFDLTAGPRRRALTGEKHIVIPLLGDLPDLAGQLLRYVSHPPQKGGVSRASGLIFLQGTHLPDKAAQGTVSVVDVKALEAAPVCGQLNIVVGAIGNTEGPHSFSAFALS